MWTYVNKWSGMAYDQTSACAAGKSLNMEMQPDNHDITVTDFKRESSHSADTGWYLRDCCQIGLSIHDFIIFIHIIFISFISFNSIALQNPPAFPIILSPWPWQPSVGDLALPRLAEKVDVEDEALGSSFFLPLMEHECHIPDCTEETWLAHKVYNAKWCKMANPVSRCK